MPDYELRDNSFTIYLSRAMALKFSSQLGVEQVIKIGDQIIGKGYVSQTYTPTMYDKVGTPYIHVIMTETRVK